MVVEAAMVVVVEAMEAMDVVVETHSPGGRGNS
jgi:hypothetical protein